MEMIRVENFNLLSLILGDMNWNYFQHNRGLLGVDV